MRSPLLCFYRKQRVQGGAGECGDLLGDAVGGGEVLARDPVGVTEAGVLEGGPAGGAAMGGRLGSPLAAAMPDDPAVVAPPVADGGIGGSVDGAGT